MILRKLERSDRQTCFGTFIRRTNKTSNSSNHNCHWCLYQKHHVMQRQEKDPLGQMLKASKRHPLSSPTQFHGCDSSGVSNRNWPLPPGRRRTSAAAQPPRRGRALPPDAAALGLGRERRPRGSPHGSRRERTRVGKLASCASLKSHSPTQTSHAIWQKNARRNTRRGESCCQWRSCD